MGYLVTIEAPDASGKATQTKLLCERLKNDGFSVYTFSFPNYGSDAAKPAELYLSGALGSYPADTNAYAASTFFAVDRVFSYRTKWKKLLEQENTIVVLDRYTTSNAVHQICKLPKEEWDGFLSWLYDFEFIKLCLPVPDITIALDVAPETSLFLLKKRAGEDNRKADIHEADEEYLHRCYDASLYASKKWGWCRIECCDNNKNMLSRSTIHEKVYSAVTKAMPESMRK